MKSFSKETRQKNIRLMAEQIFDLVIIGGGINGAGIARDAALRGMKVALIEASDFASGTSSRSSKLVHGGIRYLENFEFKLVFEALSERKKLFALAPHLVHPLRFMIPLYKGGRVGMTKMGLGMWAYDALSLFQAPELHERLSKHESLERQPQLQGQELLGSYVYSDAYMDDDRLVIETLRSAHEASAICANYVKATGALFDENGKVNGVKCRDQKSQKEFQIRAQHVLSSVGPWTDELGQEFFKKWNPVLRPTKGVHLTFDRKRINLSSAVVMAAEKRIVFAIPRHEMVIVGTTDTDYTGRPANVTTDEEDVNYLLGVVDQYFPGAKIKRSDILATYAGVRPLVQDNAESEGKTSREHVIWTSNENVTFVAGGKYTTYRLIAQQAVEKVLQHFSMESQAQFAKGDTEAPLNPLVTAEKFSENSEIERELKLLVNWPEPALSIFVNRHGAEALQIVQNGADVATPMKAEVQQAVQNTMCLHVSDFFTRRVPVFLSQADHGIGLRLELENTFSQLMNWSPQEFETEWKNYLEHCQRELAWKTS